MSLFLKGRHARLNRVLAAGLLICFLSNSAYAADLSPEITAVRPLPEIPQQISIPPQHGILSAASISKDGKNPFIVYLQDAHAVTDAQTNLSELIQFFSEQYGIRKVLVEGVQGEWDASLLRTFPDAFLRGKMINHYSSRGEMTGAETAAVSASIPDLKFLGLEDPELYLENYRAFLGAEEQKPAALTVLKKIEADLDIEREKLYLPEASVWHKKIQAFEESPDTLGDLLAFAANSPDLSLKDFPHVEKIFAILKKDTAGYSETIEAEVKKLSAMFRKKCLERLTSLEKKEFEGKLQAFQTRGLSAADFLEWLILQGRRCGMKPKLSAGLKKVLEEKEQLSAFRSELLSGELEAFLESREVALAKTAQARELLAKYQSLRRLRKLAGLQLSRNDWEKLSAQKNSFQLLGLSSKDFSQALQFYNSAVKRDAAFHQKIEKNLRSDPRERILVVAGGFHASAFESFFKEKKYSYAIVTPAIHSLAGSENYEPVMKGKVSWLANPQERPYTAFMKDAVKQLTGGLNQGEKIRLVKLWRDEILRDLGRRGELDEASSYTRFLDAQDSPMGSREDELRKVIRKYKDQTLEKVRRDFEKRLPFFLSGLNQLAQQNRLTEKNTTDLMTQVGQQTLPRVLALDGGLLDPAQPEAVFFAALRTREASQRSETRSEEGELEDPRFWQRTISSALRRDDAVFASLMKRLEKMMDRNFDRESFPIVSFARTMQEGIEKWKEQNFPEAPHIALPDFAEEDPAKMVIYPLRFSLFNIRQQIAMSNPFSSDDEPLTLGFAESVSGEKFKLTTVWTEAKHRDDFFKNAFRQKVAGIIEASPLRPKAGKEIESAEVTSRIYSIILSRMLKQYRGFTQVHIYGSGGKVLRLNDRVLFQDRTLPGAEWENKYINEDGRKHLANLFLSSPWLRFSVEEIAPRSYRLVIRPKESRSEVRASAAEVEEGGITAASFDDSEILGSFTQAQPDAGFTDPAGQALDSLDTFLFTAPAAAVALVLLHAYFSNWIRGWRLEKLNVIARAYAKTSGRFSFRDFQYTLRRSRDARGRAPVDLETFDQAKIAFGAIVDSALKGGWWTRFKLYRNLSAIDPNDEVFYPLAQSKLNSAKLLGRFDSWLVQLGAVKRSEVRANDRQQRWREIEVLSKNPEWLEKVRAAVTQLTQLLPGESPKVFEDTDYSHMTLYFLSRLPGANDPLQEIARYVKDLGDDQVFLTNEKNLFNSINVPTGRSVSTGAFPLEEPTAEVRQERERIKDIISQIVGEKIESQQKDLLFYFIGPAQGTELISVAGVLAEVLRDRQQSWSEWSIRFVGLDVRLPALRIAERKQYFLPDRLAESRAFRAFTMMQNLGVIDDSGKKLSAKAASGEIDPESKFNINPEIASSLQYFQFSLLNDSQLALVGRIGMADMVFSRNNFRWNEMAVSEGNEFAANWHQAFNNLGLMLKPGGAVIIEPVEEENLHLQGEKRYEDVSGFLPGADLFETWEERNQFIRPRDGGKFVPRSGIYYLKDNDAVNQLQGSVRKRSETREYRPEEYDPRDYEHDEKLKRNGVYRGIVEKLKERVESGRGEILSIGAGRGVLEIELAKAGVGDSIRLLDINPKMIAAARKNIGEDAELTEVQKKKFTFQNGDILNPETKVGGPYDVIVSSLVVNFFETGEKLKGFLSTVKKLLKPDGIFVFVIYSSDIRSPLDWNYNKEHHIELVTDRYQGPLSELGFQNFRVWENLQTEEGTYEGPDDIDTGTDGPRNVIFVLSAENESRGTVRSETRVSDFSGLAEFENENKRTELIVEMNDLAGVLRRSVKDSQDQSDKQHAEGIAESLQGFALRLEKKFEDSGRYEIDFSQENPDILNFNANRFLIDFYQEFLAPGGTYYFERDVWSQGIRQFSNSYPVFSRFWDLMTENGSALDKTPLRARRSEVRVDFTGKDPVSLGGFELPDWVKRAGEVPRFSPEEARLLYALASHDESAIFGAPLRPWILQSDIESFFPRFKNKSLKEIIGEFDSFRSSYFMPQWRKIPQEERKKRNDEFQIKFQAIFSLQNKILYFRGFAPLTRLVKVQPSGRHREGGHVNVTVIPREKLYRVYLGPQGLYSDDDNFSLIYSIETKDAQNGFAVRTDRFGDPVKNIRIPLTKDFRPSFLNFQYGTSEEVEKKTQEVIRGQRPRTASLTWDLEDRIQIEDLDSQYGVFVEEIVRPKRSEARKNLNAQTAFDFNEAGYLDTQLVGENLNLKQEFTRELETLRNRIESQEFKQIVSGFLNKAEQIQEDYSRGKLEKAKAEKQLSALIHDNSFALLADSKDIKRLIRKSRQEAFPLTQVFLSLGNRARESFRSETRDVESVKEVTIQDLFNEGYRFELVPFEHKEEGYTDVDVRIYKGEEELQSRVSFAVIPEMKVLLIQTFYPNFPDEKVGRGRAFLRYLLLRPEYVGYRIVADRPSFNFQKSFLKMSEVNPFAKVAEYSYLFPDREAYQKRQQTFEAFKREVTPRISPLPIGLKRGFNEAVTSSQSFIFGVVPTLESEAPSAASVTSNRSETRKINVSDVPRIISSDDVLRDIFTPLDDRIFVVPGAFVQALNSAFGSNQIHESAINLGSRYKGTEIQQIGAQQYDRLLAALAEQAAEGKDPKAAAIYQKLLPGNNDRAKEIRTRIEMLLAELGAFALLPEETLLRSADDAFEHLAVMSWITVSEATLSVEELRALMFTEGVFYKEFSQLEAIFSRMPVKLGLDSKSLVKRTSSLVFPFDLNANDLVEIQSAFRQLEMTPPIISPRALVTGQELGRILREEVLPRAKSEDKTDIKKAAEFLEKEYKKVPVVKIYLDILFSRKNGRKSIQEKAIDHLDRVEAAFFKIYGAKLDEAQERQVYRNIFNEKRAQMSRNSLAFGIAETVPSFLSPLETQRLAEAAPEVSVKDLKKVVAEKLNSLPKQIGRLSKDQVVNQFADQIEKRRAQGVLSAEDIVSILKGLPRIDFGQLQKQLGGPSGVTRIAEELAALTFGGVKRSETRRFKIVREKYNIHSDGKGMGFQFVQRFGEREETGEAALVVEKKKIKTGGEHHEIEQWHFYIKFGGENAPPLEFGLLPRETLPSHVTDLLGEFLLFLKREGKLEKPGVADLLKNVPLSLKNRIEKQESEMSEFLRGLSLPLLFEISPQIQAGIKTQSDLTEYVNEDSALREFAESLIAGVSLRKNIWFSEQDKASIYKNIFEAIKAKDFPKKTARIQWVLAVTGVYGFDGKTETRSESVQQFFAGNRDESASSLAENPKMPVYLFVKEVPRRGWADFWNQIQQQFNGKLAGLFVEYLEDSDRILLIKNKIPFFALDDSSQVSAPLTSGRYLFEWNGKRLFKSPERNRPASFLSESLALELLDEFAGKLRETDNSNIQREAPPQGGIKRRLRIDSTTEFEFYYLSDRGFKLTLWESGQRPVELTVNAQGYLTGIARGSDEERVRDLANEIHEIYLEKFPPSADEVAIAGYGNGRFDFSDGDRVFEFSTPKELADILTYFYRLDTDLIGEGGEQVRVVLGNQPPFVFNWEQEKNLIFPNLVSKIKSALSRSENRAFKIQNAKAAVLPAENKLTAKADFQDFQNNQSGFAALEYVNGTSVLHLKRNAQDADNAEAYSVNPDDLPENLRALVLELALLAKKEVRTTPLWEGFRKSLPEEISNRLSIGQGTLSQLRAAAVNYFLQELNRLADADWIKEHIVGLAAEEQSAGAGFPGAGVKRFLAGSSRVSRTFRGYLEEIETKEKIRFSQSDFNVIAASIETSILGKVTLPAAQLQERWVPAAENVFSKGIKAEPNNVYRVFIGTADEISRIHWANERFFTAVNVFIAIPAKVTDLGTVWKTAVQMSPVPPKGIFVGGGSAEHREWINANAGKVGALFIEGTAANGSQPLSGGFYSYSPTNKILWQIRYGYSGGISDESQAQAFLAKAIASFSNTSNPIVKHFDESGVSSHWATIQVEVISNEFERFQVTYFKDGRLDVSLVENSGRKVWLSVELDGSIRGLDLDSLEDSIARQVRIIHSNFLKQFPPKLEDLAIEPLSYGGYSFYDGVRTFEFDDLEQFAEILRRLYFIEAEVEDGEIVVRTSRLRGEDSDLTEEPSIRLDLNVSEFLLRENLKEIFDRSEVREQPSDSELTAGSVEGETKKQDWRKIPNVKDWLGKDLEDTRLQKDQVGEADKPVYDLTIRDLENLLAALNDGTENSEIEKLAAIYIPDLSLEVLRLEDTPEFQRIFRGDSKTGLLPNPRRARHMQRVERFSRALRIGDADYFIKRLPAGYSEAELQSFRNNLLLFTQEYQKELTPEERKILALETKFHDIGYAESNENTGHEKRGAEVFRRLARERDFGLSAESVERTAHFIEHHTPVGWVRLGEMRMKKMLSLGDERFLRMLLLHNAADASGVSQGWSIFSPQDISITRSWLEPANRKPFIEGAAQRRLALMARTSVDAPEISEPKQLKALEEKISEVFGPEENLLMDQLKERTDFIDATLFLFFGLVRRDASFTDYARFLKLLLQLSVISGGDETVIHSNAYPLLREIANEVKQKGFERLAKTLQLLPDDMNAATLKEKLRGFSKGEEIWLGDLGLRLTGSDIFLNISKLFLPQIPRSEMRYQFDRNEIQNSNGRFAVTITYQEQIKIAQNKVEPKEAGIRLVKPGNEPAFWSFTLQDKDYTIDEKLQDARAVDFLIEWAESEKDKDFFKEGTGKILFDLIAKLKTRYEAGLNHSGSLEAGYAKAVEGVVYSPENSSKEARKIFILDSEGVKRIRERTGDLGVPVYLKVNRKPENWAVFWAQVQESLGKLTGLFVENLEPSDEKALQSMRIPFLGINERSYVRERVRQGLNIHQPGNKTLWTSDGKTNELFQPRPYEFETILIQSNETTHFGEMLIRYQDSSVPGKAGIGMRIISEAGVSGDWFIHYSENEESDKLTAEKIEPGLNNKQTVRFLGELWSRLKADNRLSNDTWSRLEKKLPQLLLERINKDNRLLRQTLEEISKSFVLHTPPEARAKIKRLGNINAFFNEEPEYYRTLEGFLDNEQGKFGFLLTSEDRESIYLLMQRQILSEKISPVKETGKWLVSANNLQLNNAWDERRLKDAVREVYVGSLADIKEFLKQDPNAREAEELDLFILADASRVQDWQGFWRDAKKEVPELRGIFVNGIRSKDLTWFLNNESSVALIGVDSASEVPVPIAKGFYAVERTHKSLLRYRYDFETAGALDEQSAAPLLEAFLIEFQKKTAGDIQKKRTQERNNVFSFFSVHFGNFTFEYERNGTLKMTLQRPGGNLTLSLGLDGAAREFSAGEEQQRLLQELQKFNDAFLEKFPRSENNVDFYKEGDYYVLVDGLRTFEMGSLLQLPAFLNVIYGVESEYNSDEEMLTVVFGEGAELDQQTFDLSNPYSQRESIKSILGRSEVRVQDSEVFRALLPSALEIIQNPSEPALRAFAEKRLGELERGFDELEKEIMVSGAVPQPQRIRDYFDNLAQAVNVPRLFRDLSAALIPAAEASEINAADFSKLGQFLKDEEALRNLFPGADLQRKQPLAADSRLILNLLNRPQANPEELARQLEAEFGRVTVIYPKQSPDQKRIHEFVQRRPGVFKVLLFDPSPEAKALSAASVAQDSDFYLWKDSDARVDFSSNREALNAFKTSGLEITADAAAEIESLQLSPAETLRLLRLYALPGFLRDQLPEASSGARVLSRDSLRLSLQSLIEKLQASQLTAVSA